MIKRRLKRIPRRLLRDAREVLGIVTAASDQDTTTDVQVADKRPSAIEVPPQTDKKDNGASRKPDSNVNLSQRQKTSTTRKAKETWPIIGKSENVVQLRSGDVEAIHHALVDDFALSKDPISPPGVRDRGLLESALFRPQTSLGKADKYPTVSMSAAALLHSIVHDHPFFNGNKRTALVSMLVLLDKNNWVLTLDQDDLYNFVIALASHNIVDRKSVPENELADAEVLKTSRWIQHNIRKIKRSEYPLKLRELERILKTFDCEISRSSSVGNRLNITLGEKSTQIGYKYEGADVARNTIHKVRYDLGLDERSGVDSDVFYNRGPRIPKFINQYRKVLDRLARI